ncbi:hypothetical protein [Alkalihalobacillus sp. CinArs1]|uniref:hypothetical protein n=1 Tax=Alkalihalobacillus sp. CinArs1 TaxID=2995314 RepID=UPI0022DD543F|nr:hypothetical protein [Alkalihalobacillus sp. CinArs1]
MWKKVSIAANILMLGAFVGVIVYGQLFIENGKLDGNDKIFFGGILAVLAFCGSVFYINFINKNGKKVTARTIVLGTIMFLVIVLSKVVAEYWL